MICIHCDSEKFTEKDVQFNPTIKGKMVEVSGRAFVCSECDEALMNSEQMDFLLKISREGM